jgi:enoyl-CoA hydratase
MPEFIIAEKRDSVALLRINRPQKYNALCAALMGELNAALRDAEGDDAIGAIVVAGGERAFAAGADISEIAGLDSFADAYKRDFITDGWEELPRCRKPVIAAVAGLALGGGCELAMMCDIILAADNAQFGQPEIALGILPGAGGTQRLTRAVGKSKAMEICLGLRRLSAEEAERAGLVARVIPAADLEKEALALAKKIAAYSRPVAAMIKESVNRAFETTLAEGVRFERRMLHAAFALADRREGTAAFAEKRPPKFSHR